MIRRWNEVLFMCEVLLDMKVYSLSFKYNRCSLKMMDSTEYVLPEYIANIILKKLRIRNIPTHGEILISDIMSNAGNFKNISFNSNVNELVDKIIVGTLSLNYDNIDKHRPIIINILKNYL